MPTYQNPTTVTYTRSVAVTTTTWAIAPPTGCTKARVKGISASVTTTYNAVTTPAYVRVGVANNIAVAAELNLSTTAAGASIGWSARKGTNPLVPVIDLTGANNTAITTYPEVAEFLGPVLITFTANTGGTPAGAAVVEVTIDWF